MNTITTKVKSLKVKKKNVIKDNGNGKRIVKLSKSYFCLIEIMDL